MKTDQTGTGLGKIRHDPIHRLDHQVDIDRRSDAMLAQGLADQRANGEVRHVVIVHHIEMHPVSTRRQHGIHFFAQTSKIGGENRGRDDAIGHDGFL